VRRHALDACRSVQRSNRPPGSCSRNHPSSVRQAVVSLVRCRRRSVADGHWRTMNIHRLDSMLWLAASCKLQYYACDFFSDHTFLQCRPRERRKRRRPCLAKYHHGVARFFNVQFSLHIRRIRLRISHPRFALHAPTPSGCARSSVTAGRIAPIDRTGRP